MSLNVRSAFMLEGLRFYVKSAAVIVIATCLTILSCGPNSDGAGTYEVDREASSALIDKIFDQEFNEHFEQINMDPGPVNRKAHEDEKALHRKGLNTAKITFELDSDGTYHAIYVDPFSQKSEGTWIKRDNVIAFTPTVVDGRSVAGAGFAFYYRDGSLTSPPNYPLRWIVLSKQ